MAQSTPYVAAVLHRTKHTGTNLKATAPLLWRVVAFVLLFIAISGTLGPRIIGHGLVDEHGFQLYGPAGKALLFGISTFLILSHRRLGIVQLSPWRKVNLAWLFLVGLTYLYAWMGISRLIAGHTAIGWTVTTNISMLTSVAFAALGCLTADTMRQLGRAFKRELLISLGLAVGFTGFLYAVYALWLPLSTTVLHVVQDMLHLIGLQASTVPPDTLLLSKFGIMVSKYCSGVDSIALFTGLYVVVALLDWKKLDRKRALGIFVPALLLLFACNVLRVFVLIVAGYYINTQIAFSLFHTYAGMIFFIVYSAIFWRFAYGWMLSARSRP